MSVASITEAETRLKSVVNRLEEDLKKLRTGRANASMLESVNVEVYGQSTPLPHVATVTALDAQMLQITPFDPNNLQAISAAIRDDQALGLNPSDDGRVVRVPIPPMTTERRQEVVKQLNARLEDAKVAMRNVRHEFLKSIKDQQQAKEISEDDHNRLEKQLGELLDAQQRAAEELARAKESEIMTV